MPAQDKLSPIEQYMAYIAGLGIAIAMLALFLIGLGTANNNLTISLLIVGIVIFVLGVAGWLYFLRPWEKFDDMKTPLYTGHHEPAHAEAEKAVEAPQAETITAAVVEAPAAPVVAETPAVEKVAAPILAEVPVAEKAPVVAAEAPAAPVVAETPAVEKVAAPVVAEAVPPKPDDLTVIEGIGPKSAAALATAGITTFAQVAQMTPEALEAIIKGQKVRLVGSTATWPGQAQLAAAGNLTVLEDYQKRIKSGGKQYDDLTQIEGIGPQTQQTLYQAGIITFQNLAQAAPGALRTILEKANLKNLNPDRWPEQAALVVAKNLTDLKKLQDQL